MENQDMSLTDAVLLDRVQKGYEISKEAVAMLRKRHLIEGRIPNIYVSKKIAQATDQKVEYTKHKGLDSKKCEAFLLDSLKDHGTLSKAEIVKLLFDLLPDQLTDKQKEYKIENILKKLRIQGLIKNKTVGGNKSTWALVNPQIYQRFTSALRALYERSYLFWVICKQRWKNPKKEKYSWLTTMKMSSCLSTFC